VKNTDRYVTYTGVVKNTDRYVTYTGIVKNMDMAPYTKTMIPTTEAGNSQAV
jgi:hypothetical protein